MALPPKLVSVKVIEGLGLKAETIYRMAREGTIPSYRTGVKKRGLLFDVSEVLAAIRVTPSPKKKA